jgi:uncharacterized membrane protein
MRASSALELDDRTFDDHLSVGDLERLGALAGAAALVSYGLHNRDSMAGLVMVAAATPLAYRGVTGRWPRPFKSPRRTDTTRSALSGSRGTRVQESIRLELPIAEVYQYWRRLENLPRCMSHLERVTQLDAVRSRWRAQGPAGTHIEWEAEIFNDVENRLIAWRSLPDSEVVTAGSVNFREVRGGRSTQVTVTLQYSPPGGRIGTLLAWALGKEPSQTIREDLRRLKQMLEAGEIAQATAGGAR